MFRVDETTGCLNYFKTDYISKKPSESLDLRLIVDVSNCDKDEKTGTEVCRFNVDMGDRVYTLKAASSTESEKWLAAINEWREYILLN